MAFERTKWICLYVFPKTILLLAIIFILVLSGCLEKKQDKPFTIGFSQCVGSDLWRKTMLDEMKMELSLHPSARFIYADADGNSNRQIKQVEKMLKDDLDLLIISPNEAHPLADVVEQAYRKGIPVVVIDRKTSSPQYTAYVGANNYQIGKMAAEYLATSVLKGKGNVIEIMGLPGSSPAIERSRGFNDKLREYSDIRISLQLYGDWLKERAESRLVKHSLELKEANAIFAHNDVMANGAYNVIHKLGYSPKINVVGVDALPGNGAGLDLVANRTLNASLLYPTGGKEAISTAFAILNNEHFLKENILQTVVINSSNVQLMKMQWARISSQQKDIERQRSLLENQLKIYDNQKFVLNIIVITLVLVVVFGGLAFHSLLENRKINKRLEMKNSEILSQRNQLIEMSAKATEANEAKLNFFTNISHEFRTPLTLILSPLEDLMKDEKTKALAGRELHVINKNVFRLLRLVNQLIDYRKIEHNKFKLNASPGNIVEFLREIMENFRHIAKRRNINLQLLTNENKLIVWYDSSILDKVIFNLLSNALKFTGDNGRIYIRLSIVGDSMQIDVEDSGIGISDKEIKNIFDQFYQGDVQQTRGSGLGLALSKELIALHHGSISVESEKWKGTTFSLTLPLGSSHLTEHEKENQTLPKTRLYDQVKIYTTELEVIKENIVDKAFSPLKDQSLLIIEDNADLLAYLTEKFEDHYEVITATDSVKGLHEAYEKIPDLIISDVVITEMSGIELANKLKNDIRTSHIPIILLTARGSVQQQIDGIQSMADLYLTKPFNFDYLQANVENLIKNRDILREHYTSDISNSGKRKSMSNTLDKKFLNDFAGIVEHNLGNEHFNVEHLCREIGISRVQLYRKVKALLNTSITDYILNRRLKKAKYYLSHEDYSISEITYMVGISSPTYFSTVFKAKYGVTPSEFKKGTV